MSVAMREAAPEVVSSFARAAVGVLVVVPGEAGWRVDFMNDRAAELFGGECRSVPADLRLPEDGAGALRRFLAEEGPGALALAGLRAGRAGVRLARLVGSRVSVSGQRAVVLFAYADAAGDAAHALAESEARFRTLLDVAPDAVVIGTRERFHYANPALVRMLGYRTKEEVIARPLREHVHADDRAAVGEATRSLLSGGGPVHLPRVRCWRRDRSLAEFDVRGLTIEWGGQAAILGIAQDLTERRKVQAQLIRADRLASMGTLAAGVAHEINNPLAYLMLNLQYLMRELPRFDGSAARLAVLLERLAEADHGARRVSSIVGDLRAFAQQDDMVRGPVDIGKAVAAAVKVATNQLAHRARVVESYAPASFVEGNLARLEQVFVNLLINAGQAIPEGNPDGNEIRVTVAHEGPSIVVEVKDTGAGIPPEILGRVFDPFFTTKPRGVGTGLGLPISRSIVTALGGEITVTTAPGAGTTFRVSLPALPPPDERPATVKPSSPDAARGEAPLRARLLVVDDEPLVADMLKRTLSESHDVTVATDAQRALRLVLDGAPFDLVFCDLLMPRMSGMDLYARLKADRPGVEKRIVFMTGGAFTERAAQFLAGVPNPKLAKPFDLKALEDLVQRTLRALGRA